MHYICCTSIKFIYIKYDHYQRILVLTIKEYIVQTYWRFFGEIVQIIYSDLKSIEDKNRIIFQP